MPFINSRVSINMTDQQKETIKEKLGSAIAMIPGKSEEWLMLELADNCNLYFKGANTQPLAMIEIKVFGKIPEDCLDKKDCIYVKYEECYKWGWNGSNFQNRRSQTDIKKKQIK